MYDYFEPNRLFKGKCSMIKMFHLTIKLNVMAEQL